MDKLKFTPEDGFVDATAFPDPGSETETREQIMRLHKQTQDYINDVLYPPVSNMESEIAKATTAATEAKESADSAKESAEKAMNTTPAGYNALSQQVQDNTKGISTNKQNISANGDRIASLEAVDNGIKVSGTTLIIPSRVAVA